MLVSMCIFYEGFGGCKKILSMKICRDRKNRKLTLSQANYIEKVLQCFSIENAKDVSTPLPGHLKLTTEMCSKTQEEEVKCLRYLML